MKKGKQSGHQKWYCKSCKSYFSVTHNAKKSKVISLAETGRYTTFDISEKVGLSMRQIYRYLRQEKTYSQCGVSLHLDSEVVDLMDAMYWGRNFGLVIFQDNMVGTVLWYKFIDKKESVGDYEEGLKHLLQHGIKINGIVSDGLIGLRERIYAVAMDVLRLP